jgi:nitrogen fixation protein NifU and related proteins
VTPLYGDVVAEHARNPRNKGTLESPDVAHEDVNPLCGDRIAIELRLDRGRISSARFRGDACMIALASASLLTEMLQGRTLAEAAAMKDEDLVGALQTDLRPSRIGCATLPLSVLRAGISESRHSQA